MLVKAVLVQHLRAYLEQVVPFGHVVLMHPPLQITHQIGPGGKLRTQAKLKDNLGCVRSAQVLKKRKIN